MFLCGYDIALELQMILHCNSLSERGKRSYAAIESLKLGWGGKSYICCCRDHYPPYSSKWNPIEHRLFAQIHLAMKESPLTDYLIVKELIEKTTTKSGLKVIARIVDKKYQIGIKTTKEQIDFKRITFK